MISARQLKFREGKIGSSDTAAALGISPWQTRKGLYHKILGHVTQEPLGEIGELGNRMEPVIMDAFNRRTGKHAEPFSQTMVHPKYPWLISHIDGMSGPNTIMEIKCVGPRMIYEWGEDGTTDVPIYVTAQVTEQAIVADVEDVDVVALLGGNDLRIYPLKITKEAKDEVLSGVVNFWENHIIPEVPPAVTDKDLDLLKTLYKKISNDKIMYVESVESAARFHDYRMLKIQIEELEKKARQYKAAIQESMGDNTIMNRSGDDEFTWKWTKDGTKVDWVGCFNDLKAFVKSGEPMYLECDEIFNAIELGNTHAKKGHRVFLDKSKDYK